MHGRSNSAVSEVISYIMVVSIITTTTALVFLWYGPYMQEIESETQLNSIVQQFDYLNSAINDLIYQGVNSSKSVPLSIDDGTISIESIKNIDSVSSSSILGERIVMYYSLSDDDDYKFYVQGVEDGNSKININLTRGFSCDIRINATNLIDFTEETITENDVDDAPKTFDFGTNIKGAFKFDLINDENEFTFGRIFVFDTGSIIYKLSSGAGLYHVSSECGAVTKGYPSSSYIDTKPLLFDKDEDFIFHIIQFNTSAGSGAGGVGDYELYVTCEESSILQDRDDIYNFRMQFFNDNYERDQNAWYSFFRIYHDFVYDEAVQNTIYRTGNDVYQTNSEALYFTLVRAVCEVSLEV